MGKMKTRTQSLNKCGYLVDSTFCFGLYYKSYSLLNTVTYHWIVWLFVTRVSQLGSDKLKARFVTTFARAQTFDRCIHSAKTYH